MQTILTVDDSPSMRSMLSFALNRAGYKTVEADNGVAGLEAAKKQLFDLVITDVNMPEMDGLSLVSELRRLEDYKFTPVLVLTTESGDEKKAKGKAAGATGWIVKPFDPDQLLNIVSRVLG